MTDICVSAAFLHPSQVGGAEHMVRNLVRGIGKNLGGGDTLRIFSPEPLDAACTADVVWTKTFPGNRFWQEWRAASKLPKSCESILFTNYFTPPTSRKKRVATIIHDLQYLAFPQNFPVRKRVWLAFNHLRSLRAANRVVAISSFVRQSILAAYGAKWAGKVISIPNPVDWERFDRPTPPARFGSNDRYVLTVAADYPHKNLQTLIGAFAILQRNPRLRDVRLVLVGQERSLLRGLFNRGARGHAIGSSAVEATGYLPDNELAWLLRHAGAFCLPSLYEGFGMPAVEALGLGIPVICTKSGATPETTLGLAHYVEQANNPNAWAEALATVLADSRSASPSPSAVRSIRAAYDPALVGKRYLQEALS